MGLKIFRICFKIDVLSHLREVKRPLPIVRHEYVSGLFPSLAAMKFYKVEFANTSSASRTAKKSQKFFDLSAFN